MAWSILADERVRRIWLFGALVDAHGLGATRDLAG